MQFNPGPNKKANEFIFSRKSISNNFFHPSVNFKNINITTPPYAKYLKFMLDFIIVVDQKIKKSKKCNKLIGLLKQNVSCNALVTIYKSFIRPHFKYGDILYDKPNNQNFQNKIEKDQYNASLANTKNIKII